MLIKLSIKENNYITSRWIGMRNRSDQIDFHYFEMLKLSFKHDVVFPVSHPSTHTLDLKNAEKRK
jgi:hypothetical protein